MLYKQLWRVERIGNDILCQVKELKRLSKMQSPVKEAPQTQAIVGACVTLGLSEVVQLMT